MRYALWLNMIVFITYLYLYMFPKRTLCVVTCSPGVLTQVLLQLCNAPQFVKKPFIDCCELVNPIHADSVMQRLEEEGKRKKKSQHMLLKLWSKQVNQRSYTNHKKTPVVLENRNQQPYCWVVVKRGIMGSWLRVVSSLRPMNIKRRHRWAVTARAPGESEAGPRSSAERPRHGNYLRS